MDLKGPISKPEMREQLFNHMKPARMDSPLGVSGTFVRSGGSLPHITKWLLRRGGTGNTVEDSHHEDPPERQKM